MALIYKQTVTQNEKTSPLPMDERLIVQYFDDVAEEDKQNIVNYDDLTAEEQATFDAYKALCESKMV